ncbi:MAG: hypothetical protein JSS86_11555 [Cyanobacteria bacterium SZAS LIN-2]|nr:hypothetical protein [Cyanobacteria bacterium SZAS LIN-3]MBS1996943.1 hypothetical protein [Cyanobacteria bacterium SZAS LIN-2]MBS2009766.1 hypothetical protein [Cyanobacteria bacterium SZAS TMP-1]
MTSKYSFLLVSAIFVIASQPALADGYVTKGVKKGAEVTVDGTKKGIDVAVGGTKKGLRVAGGGVKKGLKETGKFFKKVF